MKKHKMDKQVQVRMPLEVWKQLQDIANERAPGTTPALLIRDAIHQVYPIDESSTAKTPTRRAAPPPPKKGGGGG